MYIWKYCRRHTGGRWQDGKAEFKLGRCVRSCARGLGEFRIATNGIRVPDQRRGGEDQHEDGGGDRQMARPDGQFERARRPLIRP